MKFTSHSQIIRSRLLKPGPVARSGMALLFVFGGSVLFARPSHLPPAPSRVQHASGAFTTGQYRNLFVEGGHPAEEVTNKINAAFQQLFHGDPASQAVYYMAGSNSNGPLAYVTDIKHHDVRTEGMSYGMMIAVQMNRKAEFDAIWNWSKTYLYHDSPAHPSYGFFSWQARTNGTVMSEFVAPDGES
jgi:oligosaccharide reducing-end xylanase